MGRFFDAILDGAFAGFWKVPRLQNSLFNSFDRILIKLVLSVHGFHERLLGIGRFSGFQSP